MYATGTYFEMLLCKIISNTKCATLPTMMKRIKVVDTIAKDAFIMGRTEEQIQY